MKNYSVHPLPEEVLQDTSSKLRALRKNMHFTQAQLAERSGVSLGSLKRFESSGQISLTSFLKLLLILGRLEEFSSILKPIQKMEKIESLFSAKTRK